MTSSLQTRIAKWAAPVVLVFSLACLSQADEVNWGTGGFDLNAAAITANGSVTFTNVNGQGFDIVVKTVGLAGQGMGTFGAPAGNLGPLGNSFYFQGVDCPSGTPPSTASSLLEFQFFKTGTTTAVAVSGVNFSLQDAEMNERFNNIGYFDQSGTLQVLPDTSSAFAGSNGGIDQTLGPDVIQNDSSYAGGTQMGKALDVDLSSTPITGFEMSPFRNGSSSNAGSVEMTGLGDLQMVPQGSPVPDDTSTLCELLAAGAIACCLSRQLRRTATQS